MSNNTGGDATSLDTEVLRLMAAIHHEISPNLEDAHNAAEKLFLELMKFSGKHGFSMKYEERKPSGSYVLVTLPEGAKAPATFKVSRTSATDWYWAPLNHENAEVKRETIPLEYDPFAKAFVSSGSNPGEQPSPVYTIMKTLMKK